MTQYGLKEKLTHAREAMLSVFCRAHGVRNELVNCFDSKTKLERLCRLFEESEDVHETVSQIESIALAEQITRERIKELMLAASASLSMFSRGVAWYAILVMWKRQDNKDEQIHRFLLESIAAFLGVAGHPLCSWVTIEWLDSLDATNRTDEVLTQPRH